MSKKDPKKKASRKKPEKNKENPYKCRKCGGSHSSFADDYFIQKCWCDEVQAQESGNYDYEWEF